MTTNRRLTKARKLVAGLDSFNQWREALVFMRRHQHGVHVYVHSVECAKAHAFDEKCELQPRLLYVHNSTVAELARRGMLTLVEPTKHTLYTRTSLTERGQRIIEDLNLDLILALADAT
jgi:hypothetical protein